MLALDTSSAPQSAVGNRVRAVMRHACSLAGDRFYYKGMWVPPEYASIDFLRHLDEFVYMVQTFETWLTQSFFARIEDYKGPSGLNRHHFAHGASAIWKRPTNFHRLIGILEAICFIESMNYRGTSAWFPDQNDAAAAFHDEILFRSEMQAIMRKVPKALLAHFGHLALARLDCLVPGRRPDGELSFRLGMLAKAAHADIIQPLSEAGWACDVSEPDAEREFLIVRASRDIVRTTCETQHWSCALLYTSASDNNTYRHLDTRVDHIFYRGEPYRVEQCASGIRAPVHPLSDSRAVIAGLKTWPSKTRD